jgi:hypothetical protein
MVGSYKLSEVTHVENTRSQLTWTMCSVQSVYPLWMSLIFGCPVIGKKSNLQNSSDQYFLIVMHNFLTCIQLYFLCGRLLLTLVSHTRLCPVLWNTSCGCFRKAYWFSFWPHILNYYATLLHCYNGMVVSVHLQISFFKSCHLIYCRKLYSLVFCPLYAFITCDVQLKECSWL